MSDNAVTLSNLLNERLIKVPPYQRGYAWEDRHVGEFIEDLDVLDTEDGGFRNHYTGTVVLLAPEGAATWMDANGEVVTEVDVVDGQQRLTTIIMLLSVLAERLRAENERLAERIVDRYVEVTLRTGQTLPKIRLAPEAANEFFHSRVLGRSLLAAKPQTAAQARLLDARSKLSDYVERVSKEPEGLVRLYEKVTQRLLFNVYSVQSDAEAGVIFETVNARGKPLTELELVKNYLMFVSNWVGKPKGPQLERAVNTTWSDIYNELMKASLVSADREDQLLRAHWLMQSDPNVRFQGAKSVKDTFSLRRHAHDTDGLADGLGRYVESLQAAATAFCELVVPDRDDTFADWPERQRLRASHAVRKLNSAGNPFVFRPLLVAARLNPGVSPDDFVGLVKLCEAVSFRLYRVLNARSDTASGVFARAAYDMRRGTIGLDTAADQLRSINHRYASDSRVFGALATVSNWYHWSGLRYFMYEWEAHLTGAKQMAHDWGDVDARPKRKTVEHILPQAPKGSWITSFPDRYEREELTDTLGNLMLTWDNERYSNKEYNEKRGDPAAVGTYCYFNGSFQQERHVAKVWPTWTPETIRARQSELVDFARQRWHVDPPRNPMAETLEEADDVDDEQGDI